MSSISLSVTTEKDQDIWAYVRVDLYLNNSNGSWKNPTAGSITIAGTQAGKNPELWEKNNSNPTRTFNFSLAVTSSTTFIGSAYYWIKKKEKARSWGLSCTLDLSGTSSGYLEGSGSVSVSAWTSYTVSYNANGGSGAPSNQKKWHSDPNVVADQYPLTLSSTVPTRTGYTFLYWTTNKNGTGTRYYPSGTYDVNASVTLYAQWQVNTYTVSYNANGGSGAPSSQTKTYGTDLTLSDVIPTRTGFNFRGWATSSTGSVAYSPRGIYSSNSDVELFAVWEDAYIPPEIFGAKAVRCDVDGNERQSGDYIKVSFQWQAGKGADGTIHASTVVASGGISLNISTTDESGSYESVPIALALGSTNTATITITDTVEELSTTVSVVFPKGGLAVHISRPEKAVKFFGIAEDDEEGVISEDYVIDVDPENTNDPLVKAVTNRGWSSILSRYGIGIKNLLVKAIESKPTELSITWSATSQIYAWKSGNVVTISVWNPKNLSQGETFITTLPIGWRPLHDSAFVITDTLATHSKLMRYTIKSNGELVVYNYFAFTGNSNASGTMTYVTA